MEYQSGDNYIVTEVNSYTSSEPIIVRKQKKEKTGNEEKIINNDNLEKNVKLAKSEKPVKNEKIKKKDKLLLSLRLINAVNDPHVMAKQGKKVLCLNSVAFVALPLGIDNEMQEKVSDVISGKNYYSDNVKSVNYGDEKNVISALSSSIGKKNIKNLRFSSYNKAEKTAIYKSDSCYFYVTRTDDNKTGRVDYDVQVVTNKTVENDISITDEKNISVDDEPKLEDGVAYKTTLKTEVVDKTAPVINLTTSDVTINDTDSFDKDKYVKSVSDNLDKDVDYSVDTSELVKENNKLKSGQYKVKYSAEDKKGNKSSVTLNVNVKKTASNKGGFAKPIDPNKVEISTHSGEARWGSVHCGLDLAGDLGTEIKAPADSIILYASNEYYTNGGFLGNYVGNPAGGGNVVLTLCEMDGKTYAMLYAHLSSDNPSVNKSVVAKGETLAYLGNSGNSSGPHCHLDVFEFEGMSVEEVKTMFQNEGDFNFGLSLNFTETGKIHRVHAEDLFGY